MKQTLLLMMAAHSLVGCAELSKIVKTDASTGNGSSPSYGGGSQSSDGPVASSGGGSDSGGGTPGWELKADRVFVVAPAPGMPTAPAMSPTWCGKHDRIPGSRDSILIKGYMQFNEQTREWPLSDWENAAKLMCESPSSSTVKQQTGYLAQLYINRWNLTVAEAMRHIGVAASFDGQHEASYKQTCQALIETKEGLSAPAEAWALADVYGCRSIGSSDNTWALWREPKHQSPLIRLSLIKSCLSYNLEPESVDGMVGSQGNHTLTQFLACAPLFDQLDKKAIIAELDKRTAPEWAKAFALQTLGDAQRHIAVGEQLFAKKVAKDKNWKTLRAASAKRFTEWKSEFAAHKATFAAAFAIDEALASDSKSEQKSCKPEPLRNALLKIVKTAKPATLDDLVEVATKPVAAMFVQRLAGCYAAQGREVESLPYSYLMRKSPTDRDGTLTELSYAMILALQEIRADRPNALEDVKVAFSSSGVWRGVSPDLDQQAAKVGKVTAKGDGVLVAFAPEMVAVSVCTNWVETGRIDRIDNEGKIRYRETCKSSKMTKENVAPDALTVPKLNSAGLSSGTYAQMLRLRGERGVPLAVYADKGKTKLVSALGIAL